MTRLTKCLVAAAVVAGFGLASQTASAAPPSVIVHPTIKPYPTYSPFTPRPLPYPPVPSPRSCRGMTMTTSSSIGPRPSAAGRRTASSRRATAPRAPSGDWNGRGCRRELSDCTTTWSRRTGGNSASRT